MNVLDARGRLFGWVNVLDATVALLVLALLPLGVLAYRASRVSTPKISSISPSTLIVGQPARLWLTGSDFRPYLQAYVAKAGASFSLPEADRGSQRATFLFSSQTEVQLQCADLTPDTYDLYLFDAGQQVAYRHAAFTVGLPQLPRGVREAVLRFVLPPQTIALIKVGDRDQVTTSSPRVPTTEGAVVTAVSVKPDLSEVMEMHVLESNQTWTGQRVQGQVVEVTVRIPLLLTAPGRWDYKNEPVRAGDIFTLATEKYKAHGVVVDVTDVQQLPSPGESAR